MDLTDSFTWEDLPTRDAETGHLTAAGWIPLTMKYSTNATIALVCFHIVQSTIRMATNHETVFRVWYPFDWTVSPFYELVNISQVTFPKREFLLSVLRFLNLTDWINRYFFFSFFLSFFLSSFFLSFVLSFIVPFNLSVFLPLFSMMFSDYIALVD